ESDGTFLRAWGGPGREDGLFNAPRALALDSRGNVYVADRNHARIQKFTSNGVFLATWGGSGAGDGQFGAPQAIAIDTDDSLYVGNTGSPFDSIHKCVFPDGDPSEQRITVPGRTFALKF